MQRKATTAEQIHQLMAACQTTAPLAMAMAIASGPNSTAQATSTRGLVWAEAGPGRKVLRRNND